MVSISMRCNSFFPFPKDTIQCREVNVLHWNIHSTYVIGIINPFKVPQSILHLGNRLIKSLQNINMTGWELTCIIHAQMRLLKKLLCSVKEKREQYNLPNSRSNAICNGPHDLIYHIQAK